MVSADGLPHDFFGGTLELADGEGSVLRNLSEDLQNTWASLLDIVLFATVEGVDERVAVGVHIQNEGEVILSFGQEALEGLTLGLREGAGTREESGALVVDSIRVGQLLESFEPLVFQTGVHLTEIDAEVPVQIDTLVNLGAVSTGTCARRILGVHIFPIRRDSAVLQPLVLDVSNSVNIENGHEYVLVLVEQLFPLLVLFDGTLLQELEHLVDVE